MVAGARRLANLPGRASGALLAALGLVASVLVAAAAPQLAAAQTPPATCIVPSWNSLIPSELSEGDEFRLIFITTKTRKPDSTDISHYNTHVQEAAKGGLDDLREIAELCGGGAFKVVGSTDTVAARDNTDTNTATDGVGEPIYWVRGGKVADDYADFWDGRWSNFLDKRTDKGTSTSARAVWTGTSKDGTKAIGTENNWFGSTPTNHLVKQVRLPSNSQEATRDPTGNYYDHRTNSYPLYGLSMPLKVGEVCDTIPYDSPLVPDGLSAGQQFFLLFLTTEKTTADSNDVATYNDIVQRAARKNASIPEACAAQFRAVVSVGWNSGLNPTPEVTAVQNTGISSSGAQRIPIYWLGGERIATYGVNFWSGTWEHGKYVDRRDEWGVARRPSASDPTTGPLYVWTGSVAWGVRGTDGYQLGDANTENPGVGVLDDTNAGPIASDRDRRRTHSSSLQLYGVSPVLTVGADTTPACPAEVPLHWDMIPAGVENGDKFRLLFMTSTKTNAQSSEPDYYNEFVQDLIRGKHLSLPEQCVEEFKAVVATASTLASENIDADSRIQDVEVHWLNGKEITDKYSSFWNENWQAQNEETDLRDESGAKLDGGSFANIRTWTGIGFGTSLGTDNPRYGLPARNGRKPLAEGTAAKSNDYRLYGISPVFTAKSSADAPTGCDVRVPGDWALKPKGLTVDNEFRLLFVTSEKYHGTYEDIGTYNHYAEQAASSSGDPKIQECAHLFRAVLSTATVDAKDQIGEVSAISGTWWLGGKKHTDVNATNFWSKIPARAEFTDESGSKVGGTGAYPIWTGTRAQGQPGTKGMPGHMGSTTYNSRTGFGGNEIYSNVVVPGGSPTRQQKTIRGNQLPFMAISPIFVVADAATLAPNPEITIAGGSNVTEGTAAQFTLTADPAPTQNLDVSITIADASGSSAFLASGVALSQTVTIAASDNGSKTFTVATDNDNVDEANGDITVTVVSGTGYDVGSPPSATVTVEDDDVPTISISGGAAVTEGTAAEFTFTAIPAPHAALTVDVTVADKSGTDFIASDDEGPQQVTFGAGAGSVTYSVPTTGDTTNEADGEVTVSVVPDTANPPNYYRHASQYSSRVAVNDDDAPTITVSITGGAGVTVGTDAQFSLTATPAPPSGTTITVSYTVADVGDGKDFLHTREEGQRTVIMGDGGTTTISVPTEDEPDSPLRERVYEGRGDITVTLNSGTGYGVSTTAGSATVRVTDDDPQPTVRLLGPSNALESDGSVDFSVEASHLFATNLNVSLMVAESTETGDGDFVDSANERTGTYHQLIGWTGPGTTLVASGASRSSTYSLPLVDDSTVEGNSTVTVTVVGGAGYTPDPNAKRSAKSVVITDDDGNTVPTISIAAGTASVTEGGSATFTLTAAPAPAQALEVTVNVQDASGQNRDFIAAGAEGTQTVTFTANQATKTYSIATTDDSTDEADGDIRVTIQPDPSGLDYRRAALIGDFAASVRVIDDDGVPTVTITGGDSVTEGTAATFTVNSSEAAPPGGLTVLLTVAEAAGSDFVPSGAEGANKQVVITAGNTSATYNVPTTNDGVDEPNAEVTVSLRTSSAYHRGSPSSASVLVQDDDGAVLPLITIAAGASPITEGTAATFTVTASPAPSSPLTVDLDVADANGSDFVASGDEGDSQVTVATTGTGTFTLATTADSADELDGDVTVTVVAGSDYRIGSPAPSARVTVQDDDVPMITIAAGSSPITEGDPATFTLTANPAPAVALTVNVTVAEAAGSDFVASGDEGGDTVDFAVGDATAPLSVATVNDTAFEASGAVTVTVNSGANYAISSTPPSASVTVNDNDATTVQFTSAAYQGTEGGNATVTVTLSKTRTVATTVTIVTTTLTASASDLTSGPHTVTIAAGTTSGPVGIPLALDGETEGDETFLVSINQGLLPAGVTLGSPSTTTVTIKDFNPGLTFGLGGGVVVTEAAGSGRTDTYTVVLDTQPTANVSIAVASADPAAATVKPTTLVFTSGSSGNWNEPQTVTVTGVDDSVDQDGDRSVTITHTGASANADTHYRGDLGSVTVTVQDDEGVQPPSMSVRADPAVTEGDPVTVTVTADRPPDADISVGFTVSEPAGSDYVDSSEETTHTVTIATGTTEATDTIPTVDDGAQEADGSMTVTLAAGSGYTVGYRQSAQVELLDNTRLSNAIVASDPDRRPRFGLASQRYGAEEGGVLRFAVRLSQALEQGVHFGIRIKTSNYSASSADVEYPRWRYTIPAGKRSLTVELAITDDAEVEGFENFYMSLGPEYETRDNLLHEISVRRDYVPGAWVDITDNDPGLQSAYGLDGETITESSYGHRSYRLRLTSRPEGTVTITPSSTDPGALRVSPSVLHFHPSNWGTYQWVNVMAPHDADPFDERVTITHAVSGYGPVTEGPVYTLTIEDDDGSDQPGVAVSSRVIEVDEGDSTTYQVGLNTDPGGPVTVNVRANSGDVTLSPNRLTFNSGNWDTPQPVVVTTAVDADTADDQALISHSVSGYPSVSSAPTVTVAIADNGLGLTPEVRFTHPGGVHPEGRGSYRLRVTLSHAVPADFVVDYTIGGSATEGDDYRIANRGRITIPANRLSESFDVAVVDDAEQEGDESVVFTLTPNPRLYTVQQSRRTHTLTIRDNEPPAELPVAEWAVAADTRDENSGPLTYTAHMTFSPPPTVGFDLRWTLGGNATRGTDYTIPVQGGPIDIPAGTTSHAITLTLLDDSAPDGDKTIWLTILPHSGSHYLVGDTRRHTLTIRDDESEPAEPAVAFTSSSGHVGEGAGTANVTVELSPAPAAPLTIGYTVDGTATAGSDFTIAQSGSIGVAASDSSVTIPVTITDDNINESQETIVLTLTDGDGYRIGGTSRHTLRISDNDTPTVSVSASTSSVTEGAAVEFTVTSDRAPASALAVRVRISERPGSDFIAVQHQRVWTATISAGQFSATLSIPTVNDSRLEANGRVTAQVERGGGYRIGAPSSASVDVADNDVATVSVSSVRSEVSEGGNVVFRVRANTAPLADLTVYLNITAPDRAVNRGQKGNRTVVISQGQRFADLTVATRTNIGSHATVRAAVTAHSSYAVAVPPDNRAEMRVLHNDGSISISIADASADEGRWLSFVITLSSPSPGGISVDIFTDPTDSCGTRRAVGIGVDYWGPQARLRFDAGRSVQRFDVESVADSEDEHDECFVVLLGNPVGARIQRGRAFGTIIDN